MPSVSIETKKITDKASFHQVFAETLGFPNFYGRNMDAWIDCLSDLHEDVGLCQIKVAEGEMLHLCINDTSDFFARHPELMREVIECIAFVNYRSVQAGEKPKLSVIFMDNPV